MKRVHASSRLLVPSPISKSEADLLGEARNIRDEYIRKGVTRNFGLEEDSVKLLTPHSPQVITMEEYKKIVEQTIEEIYLKLPAEMFKSLSDNDLSYCSDQFIEANFPEKDISLIRRYRKDNDVPLTGGFLHTNHIAIQFQDLLGNILELPELLSHETEHWSQALARTVYLRMHPEEKSKLVREYFVNGIKKGVRFNTNLYPYLPTQGLRNVFARFIDEFLINIDDPSKIKKDNPKGHFLQLSPNGIKELVKRFKEHDDFKHLQSLYGNDLTNLSIVLANHANEIFKGYYRALGKSVMVGEQDSGLVFSEDVLKSTDLEPLMNAVKNNDTFNAYARSSIKNYVECRLGMDNLTYNNSNYTFFNYQFSSEELNCDTAGAKFAMEKTDSPDVKKELEDRLEILELGKRLLKLRRQASVSEQDERQVKFSTQLFGANSKLIVWDEELKKLLIEHLSFEKVEAFPKLVMLKRNLLRELNQEEINKRRYDVIFELVRDLKDELRKNRPSLDPKVGFGRFCLTALQWKYRSQKRKAICNFLENYTNSQQKNVEEKKEALKEVYVHDLYPEHRIKDQELKKEIKETEAALRKKLEQVKSEVDTITDFDYKNYLTEVIMDYKPTFKDVNEEHLQQLKQGLIQIIEDNLSSKRYRLPDNISNETMNLVKEDLLRVIEEAHNEWMELYSLTITKAAYAYKHASSLDLTSIIPLLHDNSIPLPGMAA